MKKLFLLTVLLLAISCNSGDEIPKDIMSKEEMVHALIEIRVIEGQVASLNINNDSAQVLYYFLEKRLFKNLELDTASYTKSYDYYVQHPDDFLDITSAVIDSLKLRSQRLSKPGSGMKNVISK